MTYDWEGWDFDVGERVVVTGDDVHWDHGLPAGSEVTVIEKWIGKEPVVGYRVTCSGDCSRPQGHYLRGDEGYHLVAQVELEPALGPVTEEELAEVYRIITGKEPT